MLGYDLSEIDISELHAKIKALLGDKFVGFVYPPLFMHTTEPITDAELLEVRGILQKFDLYGTYDPEMIKDLSPTQIDSWIDANVVDLPSARRALKVIAHALLFLLQRDLK